MAEERRPDTSARWEAVNGLRERLVKIASEEWDEQPSGEAMLCGKDAVIDFLHGDEVEKALLAAFLSGVPSSALIAGMEAALEVCQRVEASLKEGGLREQSFGAGDCVANLNLKLGALDRSASSSTDAPGRSFQICKDHQSADWNQPDIDEEACVLCRLFYLEAQESLLDEWQERAKRAEATIAEIERPLDAQMARLNETVVRLNGENEKLRAAQSAIAPNVEAMRKALERIERWFGEFPPTADKWPDGSAVSYGAAYGSNGERDYMRKVAREALASAPSAIVPPREPTQAMYDAAKIIILPSYRGQLDNQHAYDIVSKEDMAALWQAMYDEAISRRDGGADA